MVGGRAGRLEVEAAMATPRRSYRRSICSGPETCVCFPCPLEKLGEKWDRNSMPSTGCARKMNT
ncbi:hypothetical protein E2C01_095926 [Portunus trituberculatus]|uniref:Uncharacterized protein n=1 Tax=Portunus trituberculatus TaxID=210409 RepID=A0A5B7JWM2_PORTR|nr:hypothetical protein [Portunus trituberculatus]